MTDELLAKAKNAQKNIQDIRSVLYSLECIKIRECKHDGNHHPTLRFINMLKRKDGKEVREAAVLLFDGVSIYGTEIPVDDRLLDCLKDHYKERLAEAQTEFDKI